MTDPKLNEAAEHLAAALAALERWGPVGQQVDRVICWREAISRIEVAQWFIERANR